jgi:hypothetical protein
VGQVGNLRRIANPPAGAGYKPAQLKANGRKVLHELDEVKDHPGDRTADLSYMMEREWVLPFGEWVNQVRERRNQYAKAHNLHQGNLHQDNLHQDNQTFDWKDQRDVR